MHSQFKGLKETVEALNLSCKASEDKLLLQSQLHADKLRTVDASHNTLKERCRTMAISEEHHRVANIKLEEKNKNIALQAAGHIEMLQKKESDIRHLQSLLSQKDMDVAHLQSLISSREKELFRLQSLPSSHDQNVGQLQSLICSKDCEIIHLQTQVSSKDREIQKLQTSIKAEKSTEKLGDGYVDKLNEKEQEVLSLRSKINAHANAIEKLENEGLDKVRSKEKEISSLKSKLESCINETKRLQSKLEVSQSILRAHPIDPCLNTKAKKVLRSSAEILELARDSGSVESMRRCLGQVGTILHDLNEQMDTQHRLSDAWLERVEIL
jgi:DNA repair exonuclease SbcCD ATPase subunit